MKKPVFLLVFIALFLGSPFAQDTVRYGDPWYQFYSAPDFAPNSGCGPASSYTGICGNYDIREYLGYINEGNPIYGVAVVMDSIPGPEWNFIVTLLRGIEYHIDYWEGIEDDAHVNGYIIDSCYQEDTVFPGGDPLIKRCLFEYYFGENTGTGEQKTILANCYEFYFDTPLIKVEDFEGFADTFFVGVDLCAPDAQQELDKFKFLPIYCGPSNDTATYVVIRRQKGTNTPLNELTIYQSPNCFNNYFSIMRTWGGIFPIIERRCSVPRGLMLASDSLSASWRSDTDAELFQLAVCTDTVEPDDGLLFTTSATSQVLPPFHRDSTYRLYLRKMCNFRQDSVWSDWSMPLVIAPRPSESIEEIRNSKFEIQISPNPATKQVQVTSNFNLTQINVYDEQGRLIKEFNIQHPSSIINLDISALPAGTYLLRITTPAGPTTKKLLIQ